jgi:hypothetical protein
MTSSPIATRARPAAPTSLRSAPSSFTPRTRTAETEANGFSHLRRSRLLTRSDFERATRQAAT